MTPRIWALKKAEKFVVNDNIQGPIVSFFRAAGLVESEHARAVRIVSKKMKVLLAEASRIEKAGSVEATKNNAQIAVVNDILAALQRGRTGRGK